tara:strand:+ start:530 stop:694 length:165 start_codon:yes stop_codon:yes gene_type:complete
VCLRQDFDVTEENKNKDIYKHISELIRIHELEEILVNKDKQAHIFTIAEVDPLN